MTGAKAAPPPGAESAWTTTVPRDLASGLVVFLVAVPLCLGVALASGAPLFSGVIAGIVGGIVVGALSGSQTSVAGPAAGLTAVVAAQIAALGSFPAFLLAVVLAGLIQVGLGVLRAGFVASFFPTSVVKGLLAAIGVILILKQIPHVVGHDADPEGEFAFVQPDRENTFTEIVRTIGDVHPGAAAIGLLSVALLMAWDGWRPLRRSPVPAPLIVVLLGVGLDQLARALSLGPDWVVGPNHLVQVPVAEDVAGFFGFLRWPDVTQWANPAVYGAAVTIAVVASLETLVNLGAVDKLDPRRRTSPPSRELIAQGIGNVTAGLIGGLPVTSVVARSSLNIHAGGRTKLSTIVQGSLLLVCGTLLPAALNLIPLSCLAAILLVTGARLVRPAVVKQMWAAGWPQFAPFVATVVAIVLTDPLIGLLIGLAVSVGFILRSNVRRPVRRVVEKHLGGEVTRVTLANQVSFLNRAALSRVLDEIPAGGHLLLDAQNTDYIDPDVLDLIREYKDQTAPVRGVEVSLVGFRSKYELGDQIQYVDYASREIQTSLTPRDVLQILKDGHERFRSGRRLTRDLGRQVSATAGGQHPLAVVLSCIDSRTPSELIFDLGVGDIFSIRVAGNITSRKILASAEYGCAVAGAKLILVVGHTRCGAVTAAVTLLGQPGTAAEATGCQHIDAIVAEIQESTDLAARQGMEEWPADRREAFIDDVARRNVARVVDRITQESQTLDALVREGKILVVGAMYDVATGRIEFLPEPEATSPRETITV